MFKSAYNTQYTSYYYFQLQVIEVEGNNEVDYTWQVLDKIKSYSEKVRKGELRGVTGKPLTNVVAIGIGGSFLGPLFVHTSLK